MIVEISKNVKGFKIVLKLGDYRDKGILSPSNYTYAYKQKVQNDPSLEDCLDHNKARNTRVKNREIFAILSPFCFSQSSHFQLLFLKIH